MSTKTTFKRVALVAVAALGFGVLSTVPSSASVISTSISADQAGSVTIIGTTTTVNSDSTTAAVFTVTTLMTAASDSASVTFVKKSEPAGSTVVPRMTFLDSATTTSTGVVANNTNAAVIKANKLSADAVSESVTAGSYLWLGTSAANGYAVARFYIGLDSASAVAKVGTYTYTVVVTPYTAGAAQATQYTQDVTIAVGASTDQSTTPSVVKSFADLKSSNSSGGATKVGTDAVISAVATAGTSGGFIFVGNRNSVDGYTTAADSLTATVTGAGVVCTGTLGSDTAGTCGKSIKVSAIGDYQFVLQADGIAGTSSVAVVSSVLGVTYTKSVTYYAKAAKTLTATVLTPKLTIGSNDSAIAVTAVDASGINWTGSLYVIASSATDALTAGSTTKAACVKKSDNSVYWCPVAGKLAGTAKITVMDATTLAAATATAEVTVTVVNSTAATVKIAFDKASYQPYEKATITVTPLDSAGNTLPAGTWTNLFAAGGITSSLAFPSYTGTAVDLTPVSITTSAYSGTNLTAGSYTYVVYMPATGSVTLTATGGTSLPLAGQVKVTAKADVVNSSVDAATDAANEATDAANAATDAANAAAEAADAATAAAQDASDAVAALAQQVNDLVSALKAQITSLTNIVIKIQKKLKIK